MKQRLQPILRWVCAVLIAVGLTGCVEYDVGLRFIDQHHGILTQHIQVSQQLTRFNQAAAQDWLTRIEQRTQQLGGSIKRLAADDLIVTIPFYNGQDLETKFNQFFPPLLQAAALDDQDGIEPLSRSHLTLTEQNFIVMLRDRLNYDLDLRSLGVQAADGSVLISPATLFDFRFSLTTPWAVEAIAPDGSVPETNEDGTQLVWTLQPGEINHLEAVFWLPSPLGIGTTVIVGLVALGIGLKWLLAPPDAPPEY